MKTKVGIDHDKSRRLPWRVFWFGEPGPDGKQPKYVKSFRHAREAQSFQVEKQADLNRGGRRDRPETVTLGQLVEEYESARHKARSHSTKISYQNTMNQLVAFFGGKKDVRSIRQQHAEMFISSRRRVDGHAGEISSSTRSRHVINSGAVFAAGVEWGYLDSNPFKSGNPRSSSPLHIRTTSRPWHHITHDEFERFLGQVATVQKKAAYSLMYHCGLRFGEVANLTNDKVDLERRRVLIENRPATDDVPPFSVKSETQTNEDKSRIVPIPMAAMGVLTEAMQEAFQAGGFIVLSPGRFKIVQAGWRLCRAGQPWKANQRWKPWQNRDMLLNLLRDAKAAWRRCGIELTAPFDLKTFRKSYAQNSSGISSSFSSPKIRSTASILRSRAGSEASAT